MAGMRKLDDWTPLPAERKLAEEVGTGLEVTIGDGTLPPAGLTEADPRVIRTSFLRALILGQIPGCAPHEKGVRMAGAYLLGSGQHGAETPGLDLESCDLRFNLALLACRIPDLLLMRSASLRNLYLNRSHLGAGLGADGLEVTGDVFLRELVAHGAVRLFGAELGGHLDCMGARLTAGAEGRAFYADSLEAKGGVFLRGLVAQGGVRLPGAKLGGDLDCIGARLTAGAEGDALFADRLEAKGGVFLRGLVAQGAVRLLGAKLGGNLDCIGARLTAGAAGGALFADRLEAKGNVVLDGVQTQGEVRLLGANLGGDLDCEGARLTAGVGSYALAADGLAAMGSVILRGLVAQGAVRMVGTKLAGRLICTGAQLTARTGGDALNADGMCVDGGFFLRDGTHVDGVLDLTGAEIGHINDDPGCWPQRCGDLVLDRCRYGAFIRGPTDAASRIRWLSLQDESRWGEDFWPQPWEECARVLREMGHGTAARTILIEKEKRQRAARRARLRRDHLYEDAYWHGFWDRVLGATVRYGRQPLLAFAWLGLFLLLGAVIFGNAAGYGEIKPNDPRILREAEWADCAAGRALAGGHPHQPACFLAQPEAASFPRFNAFVYSADTLIPVVSLEMQSYWIPDETKPLGAVARVYLWLHIAAGWALTLLAVAGFSGLIRTDNTR